MRHVQFERIETGATRTPRRRDELFGHRVHVALRHLPRDVPTVRIRDGRGRDRFPRRLVAKRPVALPRQLARRLAARVPDLEPDLRLRVGVDEIGDPSPRDELFIVVDARTPERDPPARRDAGRLAEDEPGTADGARAQMDEVPVVGRAVLRRVLAHRGDDDAIRKFEGAERQRDEGGARGGGAVHDRLTVRLGEPARGTVDEHRIAHRQVVVRDPPRAGHQVEGERRGVLPLETLDLLEPRLAHDRGALELFDVGAPRGLVGRERLRGAPALKAVERLDQRDRILHGELRAAADREVGRVDGVAEQHDVAVAPLLATDHREAAPDRLVGENLVSFQVIGEEPRHVRRRLGLRRLVEPRAHPGVVPAFHDPRREVLLEGIGVDREVPVLVLAENEREGGQRLRRAEPAEVGRPPPDRRLDALGQRRADRALDAVGRHDQIGAAHGIERDLRLEPKRGPDRPAAVLEDLEEPLAREPAEAVARAAHERVADVRIDVAPVGELTADLGVGLGVGRLEMAERLLGEDDPPPEGVVGPVSLRNLDVPVGMRLAKQQRCVEGSGTAADAGDAHVRALEIARTRATREGTRRPAVLPTRSGVGTSIVGRALIW